MIATLSESGDLVASQSTQSCRRAGFR